jgi:hypothetical protein
VPGADERLQARHCEIRRAHEGEAKLGHRFRGASSLILRDAGSPG